jgi:hypothetical protein
MSGWSLTDQTREEDGKAIGEAGVAEEEGGKDVENNEGNEEKTGKNVDTKDDSGGTGGVPGPPCAGEFLGPPSKMLALERACASSKAPPATLIGSWGSTTGTAAATATTSVLSASILAGLGVVLGSFIGPCAMAAAKPLLATTEGIAGTPTGAALGGRLSLLGLLETGRLMHEEHVEVTRWRETRGRVGGKRVDALARSAVARWRGNAVTR